MPVAEQLVEGLTRPVVFRRFGSLVAESAQSGRSSVLPDAADLGCGRCDSSAELEQRTLVPLGPPDLLCDVVRSAGLPPGAEQTATDGQAAAYQSLREGRRHGVTVA